ncbi:MAG: PilZ domain-containing protein [Planctomycetota bacterium]
MGNERRRHLRIPADLPFRLVAEDGAEEPFELIDLSESGARIQCAQPISPMTRIRVALTLPGRHVGQDDDVRLVTTGVVVWSHPVEDGRYDTGVFFAELEEEQRDYLQSFVHAAG